MRTLGRRGLGAAGLIMLGALALQGGGERGRARTAPGDTGTDTPAAAAAVAGLRFRELGPAVMGGRVDDFAVVESEPKTAYVGMASGGVWKTTNAGTTWMPVFDAQGVASIGALALAPSNPEVLYVGTGEANNRQSSSWGNGVYRSTDGGRTFTHLGLADTHHIGRVAVHPKDPDTAYVAAVGRLWGPNRERGLFKTTDGGRTWTNVLFIDEDTGVGDVALDPARPDTVYAASYQRRRTAWGFNGGGPGGAIYRSDDGGATWKKPLKGLPYGRGGDVGRIGLAVYRKNTDIVYAIVEHAEGGVFRSEDRGETWTRMSDINPRPPYFSQVVVDPNDDKKVWVLGVEVHYSEDGGKTFDMRRVQLVHTDFHALWIDPRDSAHMLLGTDGGFAWSWDRGKTWDVANTIATGQFYEVSTDTRRPYRVLGGLQDNGSWVGPSMALYRVYDIGITNEDWVEVGGSDGYYTLADPSDPDIVYAETPDGNPFRRDLRTHESRSIRPTDPPGLPHNRFQWDSPIVISAHDPKVLYYASQYVYRSPDRGDTWTRISEDMTTGTVQNAMPTMGRLPDAAMLSRQYGVWNWPCVCSLSESPVDAGVIWAGTDDGCLNVTEDGGKTWRRVVANVPGLPKMAPVSRIVASRHARDAAYVTFDNHRANDFEVYVFRTTDLGRTFEPISGGVRRDTGTAHVIREHPRNPRLLFLGTETGAFVSFDGGGRWAALRLNLPTVPVFDIAIQPRENDLLLGTHGRSIWVLDDITPLEEMSDAILASDLHLFGIRPATAWRIGGGDSDHVGPGHRLFIAKNPPYGAIIHYYLKAAPAAGERVTVTVEDADGRTVSVMQGAREAGVNRIVWDLRRDVPGEAPVKAGAAPAEGQPRPRRGPLVEPGTYVVKVAAGDRSVSGRVLVEEDPRIVISASDRAARAEAILQAFRVRETARTAYRTLSALRTNLGAAQAAWKKDGGTKVPGGAKRAASALLRKVETLYAPFVRESLGYMASSPQLVWRAPTIVQRSASLSWSLEGFTAAPTPRQMEELGALDKAVKEFEAAVRRLIDGDLAVLNRLLSGAGQPPVSAAPAPPRGDYEDYFGPGPSGAAHSGEEVTR